MPRRVGRRRARKHRPARRPRRGGRQSMSTTKQYATTIETVDYEDISGNSGYSAQFTLNDFTRSPVIASQYRWYRAKKVEWIYQPYYNTFQEGATDTAAVIPHLMYVMNRNQTITVESGIITKQLLEEMGAKPIKFTRDLTVAYKPNWCMPGLTALSTTSSSTGGANGTVNYGTSLGLTTCTKWLSTAGLGFNPREGLFNANVPSSLNAPDNSNQIFTNNPNELPVSTAGLNQLSQNNAGDVVYNGHIFYIEQSDTIKPSSFPIGRITARVHWEFKEPAVAYVNQPKNLTGYVPPGSTLSALKQKA